MWLRPSIEPRSHTSLQPVLQVTSAPFVTHSEFTSVSLPHPEGALTYTASNIILQNFKIVLSIVYDVFGTLKSRWNFIQPSKTRSLNIRWFFSAGTFIHSVLGQYTVWHACYVSHVVLVNLSAAYFPHFDLDAIQYLICQISVWTPLYWVFKMSTFWSVVRTWVTCIFHSCNVCPIIWLGKSIHFGLFHPCGLVIISTTAWLSILMLVSSDGQI